jgi:hypothetical protein
MIPIIIPPYERTTGLSQCGFISHKSYYCITDNSVTIIKLLQSFVPIVWTGAENLAPPGFDPRFVQPVARRNTDYTNSAHPSIHVKKPYEMYVRYSTYLHHIKNCICKEGYMVLTLKSK